MQRDGGVEGERGVCDGGGRERGDGEVEGKQGRGVHGFFFQKKNIFFFNTLHAHTHPSPTPKLTTSNQHNRFNKGIRPSTSYLTHRPRSYRI